MSDLDSLEPVVDIDAYEFTDTERQLILNVIARDEDVRVQEKSRIEWVNFLVNVRVKAVS